MDLELATFNTYNDLTEAVKKEYPHKRVYQDGTFAHEGEIGITLRYPSKWIEIEALSENQDGTGRWRITSIIEEYK